MKQGGVLMHERVPIGFHGSVVSRRLTERNLNYVIDELCVIELNYMKITEIGRFCLFMRHRSIRIWPYLNKALLFDLFIS